MADVKEASRRWLYSGKHPNRVAAVLNRGQAVFAAAGVGPRRLVTLEVRGRSTGRRVSFPVVVADHEGQIVAMLGNEANWVRNVRVAGGEAVLRHGRRERVHLELVDPGDRAPILRRALQVAPGARAHFAVGPRASLEQFDRIADQYPVFRVCDPTDPAGREGAS